MLSGREIYDAVMKNREGGVTIINPPEHGGSVDPVAPVVPVVPGTDIDMEGNTTFVDYQQARGESENEGYLRSSVVDPAEARLFLNTDKEAKNQQKLWDNFSRVEPGFSLGSPNINPIAKHNQREDALRFKNNYQRVRLFEYCESLPTCFKRVCAVLLHPLKI